MANMLITDAVLETPWAILPSKLVDILTVLQSKELGELQSNEELKAETEKTVNSEKRYKVENGIAVIPIYGTLSKRFNLFMALSGGTSYQLLEKDIQMALDDNSVKGLFFETDSPGGSIDGLTNVSDLIYNARSSGKPSMAFADGLMASAAYFLGSATDYIVAANKTTQTGSIGVIMPPHFDFSKKLEKDNIKVTMFYSGRYKATPNQYTPLTKNDKGYIQDKLDYLYSIFIDTVAKHRDVPADMVNKNMADGRIFIGKKGIEAGLIDEILSRKEAMQKLSDVIEGKASFEKNKINSKFKGGGNKMDLEARVKLLEEQLVEKDKEISAMKNDEQVKAIKDENVELQVQVENLTHDLEESKKKVESLESEKANLKSLADIGKKAIDELKAEIMKLSVQVKGDDHKEEFLNKQLEVFAKDYDALLEMKADFEKMRAKIFKDGKLEPDLTKTEDQKKAEEKQNEYTLGQKIGNPKLVVNNTK